MKKTFPFLLLLVVLITSCGEDENIDYSNRGRADAAAVAATTDPLLIEIRDLEGKVSSDTAFDRTRALRLLKVYQQYFNAHSKDTTACNYLFEAANLAQKMDKHQKAIELFINFQEAFPTSHRADEAVFNIAYIYDARLKDNKNAEKYYNKVIELYPESMWAKEAQGALQLVNMTDEQLLQFVKDQNK